MWTYEKPTEEGHYLVNYGDVVTESNLIHIQLKVRRGELIDVSDDNKLAVDDFGRGYKFLKLDVSELNQLGNAD